MAISRRAQDAIVVTLCLAPLIALSIGLATDRLGANPIEEATHETGEAALRLLVLSLCVTPARRLLGFGWAARHRRTLGLFAFFYAALHFTIYVSLDLGFDLAAVAEDLVERPYITAGFTAFVLLTPLAATSTRAAIRRLGARWQRLHRLVYVAAIAAVVHYLWLVKADLLEPLIYGGIVAALLGYRLAVHLRRAKGVPA